MAAPGSRPAMPRSRSSPAVTAMACIAVSLPARRCSSTSAEHRSPDACRWTCWRWTSPVSKECASAPPWCSGVPGYRLRNRRVAPALSPTSCSAASVSGCPSRHADPVCLGTGCARRRRWRSKLVDEESHLDARELDDVVVVQSGRLLTNRRTVEQREVALAATVDMHDVVRVGAAGDRSDLDARTTECRERLTELDFATRKRSRQNLQLRLLQCRRAIGELTGLAGRGVRAHLLGGLGGGTQLLHRAGGGLDHHGLLELVLLLVVFDEAQLVMTTGDHVAMLQRMLLDELAVDVRAVGAVQILEERIVEDVDDQRVVPAHRGIVDADVVVRQPADGVTLLVHVVFRHHLTIQAQDQPCHVRPPLSRVSRTNRGSCRKSWCAPGTDPRCAPSVPIRCRGLRCRWPAESAVWRPYPD